MFWECFLAQLLQELCEALSMLHTSLQLASREKCQPNRGIQARFNAKSIRRVLRVDHDPNKAPQSRPDGSQPSHGVTTGVLVEVRHIGLPIASCY